MIDHEDEQYKMLYRDWVSVYNIQKEKSDTLVLIISYKEFQAM
jgi:hypothetical protein